MLPLLGAWVFWLMLNGRLGVYAAFVTTANPKGGGGSIFSGWSIPVSFKAAVSSATGAVSGKDNTGGSTQAGQTGGNSQSGQPMPGANTSNDVMSQTPPGTSQSGFGTLYGPTQSGNYMSPWADSLGYLKQAQGYVSGGGAGL